MTTEPKFDCIFCKEVFGDKEALLIHFRKHGDPKFNTNTKNKNRQQNEMPTNEKSVEGIELVGCDVCDEVFPTISKAITHKHKAHPNHDAKYFCPFCGKLFTMKHLYNKHMQLNHESTEGPDSNDFHCDSCEVTFYMPSAMLYHNKFFHRQDTELPAVGQSKKVKTHNQELIQIYYCSFCGEEYNNKVNLHKHMTDDHCDENQSPTEILRCPLCEAIFYHLDAYELHLTFHSSEDLYSEQNEMKEKVTEFSLETVPPIVEKVEDEQQGEDYRINTESIDNFLQLVMGEPVDNDTPDKVKSKKHKKHKKSKKAPITLDEFLNMNKDVFGDGLDVQGIEEVPTQEVLKKVKGKKFPYKNEPKMVNAELDKLKKHGIVVTKSGNNPLLEYLNNEGNESKAINTPNEILSKLIKQGNNQIKIAKNNILQNITTKNDTTSLANTNNEPINENIYKDVAYDHEEEANNSSIMDDNLVAENVTDNNWEQPNELKKNEYTNKSGPEMLNSSYEKVFEIENNKELFENFGNFNSVSQSPYISDTKISTNTSEENTANIFNINSLSPIEISKTLHELEQDLLSNYTIFDEESFCTTVNNDDNNKAEVQNNIENTSVNALKHLSHLITIKPVNQGKTINASSKSNEIVKHENKDWETIKYDKELALAKQLPIEQKLPSSKPLSEPITTQLSKPSPSSILYYNAEAKREFNDNHKHRFNTEYDKIDGTKAFNENVEVKNIKAKNPPISLDTISMSNEIVSDTDDEEELINEKCLKKVSNFDILKRLTNVTAKPITVCTGANQRSNIKLGKANVTQVKEALTVNPSKGSIDKEIEIFNIDDSDSESNESDAANNKIEIKSSNVQLPALKNLGKNISVKSNQSKIFPSESKEKGVYYKNTRSNVGGENIRRSKQSSDIQKSINLQNKLKILGGNITVKSRNSSPSMYNKELYKSFEDYDEDESNDSDSESYIGNAKITEINEDDDSDDERNESQTNPLIDSPKLSDSENEDYHEDMEDDLSDFESQVKTNPLKKENTITALKQNTHLENFKNLNKDLTIKSLNTKKHESEEDSILLCENEPTESIPNLNKQIATKQLKSNFSQNEHALKKSSQPVSEPMNKNSFNDNVSTSNQVNTVKTVKRVQSQTIIEEITTTVTKTIRTVNQSGSEVVQNRSNSKSTTNLNKQPGKELQGGADRYRSPSVGPKIRNTLNVVKNPNSAKVRSSNQHVPVRSALNSPRSTGPSTTAVKRYLSNRSNPEVQTISKLKISPHALNQAKKRPTDEATGHYSCNKKTKESLVNSSDTSEYDDDSVMKFSSATQSRSDSSGVSNSVTTKGMSPAAQTRSEVSPSSEQHLSRLSNVSGLKIVKTSKKQPTQVEEKCDMNTPKNNTLEALEKLQKQGLLIKKPRINNYNVHPNSFSESDDDTN